MEELTSDVNWIWDNYSTSIGNTGLMLDNALKMNEHVILEGAQGCLLDIDQGTFPLLLQVSHQEVIQPTELEFTQAMLMK